MKQHGFLVIADITGYTDYLKGSELEHAQDSLRSLLKVLIEHTGPPLVISRLEGDAVISYAVKGSFIKTQSIIERLENMYVAFRQAQQRMRLNTTCTCQACKNIPSLNLKAMVHFGEFMIQELGPYSELIGNDVNLIHRLMKNAITPATRLKAYTGYTAGAIEAMDLPGFDAALQLHLENDPHAGEIELHIQDLVPVWERGRERQRVQVAVEDALFTIEEDFPVSPALLWDYLTSPEYRSVLQMADETTVEDPQAGRTGLGSTFICAHGDYRIRQAIVDWRPFEYYTYESEGVVPGTKMLITMRLVPLDQGTRVVGICSKSIGDPESSAQGDVLALAEVPDNVRAGCRALYERVLSDLELGIIVQPHPTPAAAVHLDPG